jgi:hypothetical protein
MAKRIILAFVPIVVVASAIALAQNQQRIREFLTGYEEVPAVSTSANAEFHARIVGGNSIQYELRYADLEGSITQSHIHFGQKSVNGSIEVWLCGNPGPGVTPPAGTQACPPSPATITGTITAPDVIGQPVAANGSAGQGIQAMEFDELLRAIRAGKTYVNIHSTKFPGGEVRSQIENDSGHDGDHHGTEDK